MQLMPADARRSATPEPEPFDELAGRIEGLARAVLVLAQMLEAQADVDGQSLSARWRRSVAAHAGSPSLATARRTLAEMAAQLDEARATRAAATARWMGLRPITRPPEVGRGPGRARA